MKHSVKTVIKAAIAAVIAVIALYFWKFSPVKVQTLEVKSSAIEQTAFGTGTLEGKTRLSISPKETGSIRKLFADQGNFVKAGTLLAEMDSDDITQQMQIAVAELAVAKASLLRIEAEIRSARANAEYANSMFNRLPIGFAYPQDIP
jgi:multidrug efflux pump subunit AcrA (membrane-fusion protein)